MAWPTEPEPPDPAESAESPAPVLAGEGLHDRREVREQGGDEGSSHELGHPPAPVGAARDGTVVEALHEGEVVVLEQGSEDPHHEADVELVFDPPWNRTMMSEAARLETGML